jgi:DNA-binding response OmpR family regulator
MCAAKRLLIIDDDLDLLMLLERQLTPVAKSIETAASLPEAEEILTYYRPDVVLLDVNVNGDDGRQLCYKLKHSDQFKHVKVIMMSGYDQSTSRAVIFGADEMVVKPFSPGFIQSRIAADDAPVFKVS